MPDFVSENSLNASELEAQLKKAKEANERHMLEEEPERKSLYEQLKESKGMLITSNAEDLFRNTNRNQNKST